MYLLYVPVAFIACFIAIFSLHPFAEKLSLLDHPDERKNHVGSVSLIGGIAVFFSTLIACLIAFPNDQTINLYLISSALIVALGAIDDSKNLSVRLRLIMQILIACILVFGANMYIHKFGTMFGFYSDIGIFGTLLTIFAVLGAINAFNMVDGIDGLAGLLALNAFVNVGILLWLSSQDIYLALPVILSASLIVYLLFNLDLVPGSNKIFMGDAGSMFIGLTIIWLLTLGSQSEQPAFRTVAALWVIALPLMDMAAIILRRVARGDSPFEADREHLHHLLMREGYSTRSTLLIMMTISLIFSCVGILGEIYQIKDFVMFYAFLATFFIYFLSLKQVSLLTRIFPVRPSAQQSNLESAD